MRIRKRERLWALVVSAALVITQLPVVAMAESGLPADGAIAAFEPLESGIAEQSVPVGTERSALTLPETVWAQGTM